ncbi:DUF4347 domain-containing protein [filamentous cyanobacterium LEGE 11480]|uniref:DUF4347 domain-containing protein n=1 Tax=Romeriopsis navalis LEGE 11480 TaxID=2777977 RepID=A0A928Z706_9CYAN|nr:DUF4347 domain-containing protein [Romeriopsis navalis]MBE9032735.1 DUF4347 domain-containing protein [Romeriopsis navalis LEGE 11480]
MNNLHSQSADTKPFGALGLNNIIPTDENRPLNQLTYSKTASTLLFIDAGVTDVATLANSAVAGTEVHVLQSGQDAIAQITATLLGRSGIESLQIVSHGKSGGLQLGQSWLNLQNLSGYVGQMKSWGEALTQDADILLYGCNVAQDSDGQAFVNLLAQATGADIAASDDLTGSATLGGNWNLEFKTGDIEAAQALEPAGIKTYDAVLDDPSVLITLTDTSSYTENAAPGLIAPNLTLTDPDGLNGVTVSITDNFNVDDRLGIAGQTGTSGTINGLAWTYAITTGILTFTGSASEAVYQDALRQVTYSNVSDNPTPGDRSIQFVLASNLANPDNGHFYEFVNAGGPITWTAARDAAAARSYFGLQGYLVTVTSAAESEFVSSKLQGQGWLGASDLAVENQWRWVTGPEAGQQFWQGLGSGTPVDGRYSNWNTGEPNNSNNEDYGQFLANGEWNDLPNSISSIRAYVVEYGGFSNDPVLQLTGNSTVTVIAANDSPVLNTTVNPVLNSVSEDAGVPSGAVGTLVSALVDLNPPASGLNNVTDQDIGAVTGIAITAADTSNGTWFYSTTNGSTWTTLDNPSTVTARLLAADANTRVYFQPNDNYSGTISEALSFRAWDSSSGSNGGTADTNNNGGTTAFSFATDTAAITVNSVNDSPNFTGNGALAAIAEDTLNPAGQTINGLFSGLFSDVDSGSSLGGVAIVGNTANATNQGVWQYSTNATDWFNVGAVTDGTTALALSATTALRFLPVTDYDSTPPSLTVRAIDNTYSSGFSNGGTRINVNTSTSGGITAISGSTTTIETSVTPENDPTTGSVTINGTATQGEILTASNTLADADGLGTISYQWKADGVDIPGATSETFTLGQDQVDKAITVTASYTDAQGTDESLTSSASSTIANINDPTTGDVTISGTATQGEILTASNTLADADGLGTVSYQWKADGVDIPGATNETFTLGQDQVDKTITVTASYIDAQGTNESLTSSATASVFNVNDPTTGDVKISGTATQGEILTASNTLADADGLGTVSYQWKADGVDIPGATSETFTLGQDQVGKTITVTASYTDAQGTDESLTSSATTSVFNVNDPTTGDVTITGTATQGEILTASNTLADADGLGTITYQWQADGVDIPGATSETFTLGQDQVDKTITVVASYIDALGANESVTSSTSIPTVTNVNDAPTGTVTINGTVIEDATLTVDTTDIADADGLGSFNYQWQVNNGTDTAPDWQAITGATNPTLTLEEAQSGKAVRVQVSYTDAGGMTEILNSEATELVENVNDAPTALTLTNQITTLSEDADITVRTKVADLNITDDITGNNSITLTGADADKFEVDGNVLYFKANTQINFELRDTYQVFINIDDVAVGTSPDLSASFTLTITNADDPLLGSITINGNSVIGNPLSVTNTLTDEDGLDNLDYQWQSSTDGNNWTDIPTATSATFAPTTDQLGQQLRVKVTSTDNQSNTAIRFSPGTLPVQGIVLQENLTTPAGVNNQNVDNWASNLTQPGYPAGLTYVVTVDRPELFETLPTLSPDGTLTYTPKPNVNINADVQLSVQVKRPDGTIDPSLTRNTTLAFEYQAEALLKNSASGEIGLLYIDQVNQLQKRVSFTYGSRFGAQVGEKVRLAADRTIADTADFNRDGIADVLTYTAAGDEVAIWMMDNNGVVNAIQSLKGQDGQILRTRNQDWQVIGFHDIDQDNTLDIVWHNQQSDEVAFWFMQADGVTVREYDYLRDAQGDIFKTGNSQWQLKAATDFDGDGKADLLFRLPGLNQTAIVRLDGRTLVDAQFIQAPTANDLLIRGVADSNGDQIADIYWQSPDNANVVLQTITFNNGQFQSDNFTSIASNAPLQVISDLDSNNTNDLLFRNSATDGVIINVVNPNQPTVPNQVLQQAGVDFQLGDPNWQFEQADDFGEVVV